MDLIVEDEAENYPGCIVEWRRRGSVPRTCKDDWEVDVLEGVYVELLVNYPLDQWRKGTKEEEEHETMIELTMGEQPLWPDNTPL